MCNCPKCLECAWTHAINAMLRAWSERSARADEAAAH